MKVNSGQAPSTLIPEYIGSDFDKVIEVADNIEYVKDVAAGIEGLPVHGYIGNTPPLQPLHGAEWYCTTDGRTYVWYADVDSGQWVESSPQSVIETDPSTANNIFALWKRSAAEAGLNLVAGSFEEGGVLTSSNDVLLHKNSKSIYAWSGAFPVDGKVVAAGSTPTPFGSGGWIDRSDVTLRSELANENSDILISGVQAGKIQRNINDIKALPSATPLDGASFMLRGFYPTNDIGGGELRYDSSKSKALHNGGTVIAPEAIAAWDGTLTNIDQLLAWTGTGTGCYVRTSREIDPAMFGAVDDVNQDSTKSSQAAIYACAVANWRKMTLSGNYAIFAPLVINRKVGTGEPNSYWNIVADEVGGFTCRFSGALFTSTLTQSTDDPVSQLIRFKGVNLSGDGNGTDRFILDGNKFLRICFNECTMNYIRCLNTIGTKYIQSYYFNSCNIRKCTGTFLNADVAYDLKVNAGTLVEAHGGDLFRIKTPIGCSFLGSTFEGVSGTAFDYEQAQGLAFVGMYWEGNGRDIDGSNSSGNVSYGVANIGGVHSVSTLGYNVKWGPTLGAISAGNWATDKMHEFTTQRSAIETLVQDEAQHTLSNGETRKSGGAYVGDLPLLQLRTDASDSYTTAITYSNFVTRDGFVEADFVATMTSTASNPAGKLYIIVGMPLDASSAGMLCGTVVVDGAGHSPCTVFNATPCRVMSVDSVVPAMENGVSKQVSGQIRYKFTV